MYSQLIYYIIVLLLFSFQPPTGSRADYTNASYIIIAFLLFVAHCRACCQKIEMQAARGVFLSTLSLGYYRLQTRLNMIVLALLFLYIYAFNLQAYLRIIPGFIQFSTISGLTGLIVYLAHLCVLWFFSHPAYQVVHGSQISRSNFVKTQLSFSVVILAPWLLISSITDLLQFIKTPSFFSSDFGQFMTVAVALFGFILFGPWLMVRLWRCEPLQPEYIRNELETYCREHNFSVGGFLSWPLFGGEMLTAGIVGILPGLRYILITSGLINLLDIPELKAVVAHEMGHVRKKHLLMFAGLFILFILVVYTLGDMPALFILSNRSILELAMMPGEGAYIVWLIRIMPTIILMVLFLRFIFGFFLRNSERQADLFALQLLGTPMPLVSSFEKIARCSGKIADLPNWHHYGIRQRIDFLFAAFENRNLIREHNRKLYGAALAFVGLAAVLFFASAEFSRSKFSDAWLSDIQLAELEMKIAQNPDNIPLQAAYGGLLFEKARYSEAESVLSAALALDPLNPSILNNLAWLYATTPAPFRNPPEALELALRAAAVNPEPYVLDTLAEAYYVNGRYREALAAINEALAKVGPERDHYLKQKEKFQRALRGQV
ncbi:MAG: M48 family metalloprotease [Syntrophobacter sp.]